MNLSVSSIIIFCLFCFFSSEVIINTFLEDEKNDFCSCINQRKFDVKKDFKLYDYVFTGRIDSINVIEVDGFKYNEYYFKVYSSYKNNLKNDLVKVISPQNQDACGVDVETDKIHIVFLNKYGKYIIDGGIESFKSFYWIDYCSSRVEALEIETLCELDKLGRKSKMKYSKYPFE